MSYSFCTDQDRDSQSQGTKVNPSPVFQLFVSISQRVSETNRGESSERDPWWLPIAPPRERLTEKGSAIWNPNERFPFRSRRAFSPPWTPMDREGEKKPNPK